MSNSELTIKLLALRRRSIRFQRDFALVYSPPHAQFFPFPNENENERADTIDRERQERSSTARRKRAGGSYLYYLYPASQI